MANDKNPGDEMVTVGHVYKEVDGALEVIPFFVDFGSSMVQFAPVASGREDRMLSPDFLKRFKYMGLVSSRAEEQTEKKVSPDTPKTPAPVAAESKRK